MASASGVLSSTQTRSAPFTPTAGQVFTVEIKGANNGNPVRFIRSVDGGGLFTPCARDAFAEPAIYTGDINFDVTETRAGVQYALELTNPDASRAPISWEIYQ